MSTRLINAIEHRRCHRRAKPTPDKYDIEIKRLKVIQRIMDIKLSYPTHTIDYATNKLNKASQGTQCHQHQNN